MYNTYYGLTTNPFQLNPDPNFYFSSTGHNRAMAYLDYGLSRAEGFIVITGEVGTGKTTLVRSLCRKLATQNYTIAHIVNTALNPGDILRMVVAAFKLPFEHISKAALLLQLEAYMNECYRNGTRILLIVDEAQNLSWHALEELRMLSNLHVTDGPLLQTVLLGQPEFRRTLMSEEMTQLRQRVIATYHLGPLDAVESKAYIEHRLHTAGWRHHPTINDSAFAAIHAYTQGVPRRINTLCDRLFLMGFLEQLHHFDVKEVNTVIADIDQEFSLPAMPRVPVHPTPERLPAKPAEADLGRIEEHVSRMELSLTTLLDALRKMVSSSQPKSVTPEKRS